MSDVADMLGLEGNVPSATMSSSDEVLKLMSNKQKSAGTKQYMKKPKGMSREVYRLLGKDSLIPSVQSSNITAKGFKDKRSNNLAGKWLWKPIYTSSKGVYQKGLPSHWIKADITYSDYPYAKFDLKPKRLEYTEEEYSLLLVDPEWSRADTDLLVQICEQYECRWPVISDRIELSKPRDTEELQDRYLFIRSAVQNHRQGASGTTIPLGAPSQASHGTTASAADSSTVIGTSKAGDAVAGTAGITEKNSVADQETPGNISLPEPSKALDIARAEAGAEAGAASSPQQVSAPAAGTMDAKRDAGAARRRAAMIGFDLEQERTRRQQQDALFRKTREEEREEMRLREELKAVETALRKIKKPKLVHRTTRPGVPGKARSTGPGAAPTAPTSEQEQGQGHQGHQLASSGELSWTAAGQPPLSLTNPNNEESAAAAGGRFKIKTNSKTGRGSSGGGGSSKEGDAILGPIPGVPCLQSTRLYSRNISGTVQTFATATTEATANAGTSSSTRTGGGTSTAGSGTGGSGADIGGAASASSEGALLLFDSQAAEGVTGAQCATLSQSMVRKMNLYLRELDVPEHPLPTRAVCDLVDHIRRNTVTLLAAHSLLRKKRQLLDRQKESDTSQVAGIDSTGAAPGVGEGFGKGEEGDEDADAVSTKRKNKKTKQKMERLVGQVEWEDEPDEDDEPVGNSSTLFASGVSKGAGNKRNANSSRRSKQQQQSQEGEGEAKVRKRAPPGQGRRSKAAKAAKAAAASAAVTSEVDEAVVGAAGTAAPPPESTSGPATCGSDVTAGIGGHATGETSTVGPAAMDISEEN